MLGRPSERCLGQDPPFRLVVGGGEERRGCRGGREGKGEEGEGGGGRRGEEMRVER